MQSVRAKQSRKKFKAERQSRSEDALHVCSNCGATEHSNPEKDFRYKTVEQDVICLCNECRAK